MNKIKNILWIIVATFFWIMAVCLILSAILFNSNFREKVIGVILAIIFVVAVIYLYPLFLMAMMGIVAVLDFILEIIIDTVRLKRRKLW